MRFRTDRPTPLRGCTPARGEVELPERLPKRPVQWRRILPTLRVLRENPENTEKAFEMFEAVGGRGDEGLFRSFAVTQEGQRLLRERPVLLELLSDREALAAMPAGSLGRAYLEFARENGFAADGLLRARDEGLAGLDDDIHEDMAWFFDRMTLSHDLWHVLTGYGTDEMGELALLGYSRAQGLAGRAISFFTVLGATFGGPRVIHHMYQADRRGKQSACLVAQRWEEWLPLPLERVRTRLLIPPLADAHPNGLLRLVDDQLVREAA